MIHRVKLVSVYYVGSDITWMRGIYLCASFNVQLCSAGCSDDDFRRNVPECISKCINLWILWAEVAHEWRSERVTFSSQFFFFFFVIVLLFHMCPSAGRLSYKVNPDRKELSVNVTDMLHEHNYHLRLCHKDFICSGTGAYTLVRPSYWSNYLCCSAICIHVKVIFMIIRTVPYARVQKTVRVSFHNSSCWLLSKSDEKYDQWIMLHKSHQESLLQR